MPKRNVSQLSKLRCAAAANWRCAKCDCTVDAFYEIDHVVPLHMGGSNATTNLTVLCLYCHKEKTYNEMLALHGSPALIKRAVGAASNWQCAMCDKTLDAHFEVRNNEPLCTKCSRIAGENRTQSIGHCQDCSTTFSKYFRHTCQHPVSKYM